MRLLNVNTFEFAEFRDDERPKYAIASHRWAEGGEVTPQDVHEGRNKDKSGYQKIVDFAGYVDKYFPSVEWIWVDTCCIDKTNSAELSRSLNLMFDWYREAVVCIAYFADVEEAGDKTAFARSEWFERGWTLQELLAPRLILFVTKTWQVIGNKGASAYLDCGIDFGPGLEANIAAITGIAEPVLRNYTESTRFSVAEKLAWMKGRSTTEPEDMSYALFGICGVRPGANYGEGFEGARQRLLAAIHHQDNLCAQQADRFQDIVSWLSPPNPWTNHQSARLLHQSQTGAWLIQSNQYHDWKAGRVRHLWLHGKAGCGKTILCSTAIEKVKAYCESRPHAGYAVFYFSFTDTRKQCLFDLLRSLVAQLGWKGPAFSMLRQAYDQPNRSILGVEELESTLVSSFDSYDEVFLLVDALDECPEDNDARHTVLQCLARMMQRRSNVRLLSTSRELENIRTPMVTMGAQPMSIAIRAVDMDIRQYVRTQLSLDQRLSRLDLKTKMLIEETISAKSDGMFRWAYCQLQELKKLKSTRPKFVKDALYSLPTTLDETYARMLDAIEEKLRPDALSLLRWLAYAESPPSLCELVDATVIDLTADKVEVADRPMFDDTLEILSGLVTTIGAELLEESDNKPDQTQGADSEWSQAGDDLIKHVYRPEQIDGHTRVRLAHFSVKEYLESPRILQSNAKDFHLDHAREHWFLTQSCLVYLMHYSSSDQKASTKQDFVTFPLLRYTAESWYYHAALQQTAELLRETDFLFNGNALYNWLLIHQPDRPWKKPFDRRMDEVSGLYFASLVGLEAVVEKLLQDGADVHTQGGHYGNALQAASHEGYEKVVQMLIDAGASVNAQDQYRGGNALQAAASTGHEKVVRMLIDAGASVNAQDQYGGGNALQAAAHNGYEKVAQVLIDAGVDVNTSHALQAAAHNGYEKVVQVLIDAGADLNIGKALRAAARGGHEKVVQMLTDAGARAGILNTS